MAYATNLSLDPEAQTSDALTTRLTRDPQRDTTDVDPQYLETVTIHDRDFQKYSIDNSIHLVPVDEVSKRHSFSSARAQSVLGRGISAGDSTPIVQRRVRRTAHLSTSGGSEECPGLWLWCGIMGSGVGGGLSQLPGKSSSHVMTPMPNIDICRSLGLTFLRN